MGGWRGGGHRPPVPQGPCRRRSWSPAQAARKKPERPPRRTARQVDSLRHAAGGHDADELVEVRVIRSHRPVQRVGKGLQSSRGRWRHGAWLRLTSHHVQAQQLARAPSDTPREGVALQGARGSAHPNQRPPIHAAFRQPATRRSLAAGPTLLLLGSMLAPTAAAARSSGSNWRGGGVGWRRSSAQAGKCFSVNWATAGRRDAEARICQESGAGSGVA